VHETLCQLVLDIHVKGKPPIFKTAPLKEKIAEINQGIDLIEIRHSNRHKVRSTLSNLCSRNLSVIACDKSNACSGTFAVTSIGSIIKSMITFLSVLCRRNLFPRNEGTIPVDSPQIGE
jgi:hypothetical protein